MKEQIIENPLIQKYFLTKNTSSDKPKVMRSIDNYELWKEQTREKYYKLFPNNLKGIDRFMVYMSSILDRYERSYIDRDFMFYLWGKKN